MSDDNAKFVIPRYLDEPTRIILWTWDEVLAFLLPMLVLYMLTNQLLVALLVGAVVFLSVKTFKGQQGRNRVLALLYWHLPSLIRFQSVPPSFIRHYLG